MEFFSELPTNLWTLSEGSIFLVDASNLGLGTVTSLQVTLGAGSSSGHDTNPAHAFSYSAGDELGMRVTVSSVDKPNSLDGWDGGIEGMTP